MSGLSVLVVDDAPDVRMLVRMGLAVDDRFDGDRIREAANGSEAIAAAADEAPDVILLDEQMPVMAGHEALPELRRMAPGARIVMYTAIADVIDLRDGVAPDAVMSKGSDLFDLFDVLAADPAPAASPAA